MEISESKFLYHYKLICKNVSIVDASDATVSKVFDALVKQYKEYSLKRKIKVIELIKSQLTTQFQSIQRRSDSTTGTPVMSLNRSLSTSYTSKRVLADGATENAANAEPSSESAVPASAKKEGKTRKRQKIENDDFDLSLMPKRITGGASSYQVTRPEARLSDLAGVDAILEHIRELTFYPIYFQQLYSHLGVCPPCGLLLQGPSGCGKTLLAYAIAGELNLPFYKASGPDLIGGASGESEQRIKDLFDTAVAHAPSVLFIDAIDVIASKKDGTQRGMDRRVIAQLFDSIDAVSSVYTLDNEDKGAGDGTTPADDVDIAKEEPVNADTPEGKEGKECPKVVDKAEKKRPFVVLIAATNKADSLDPGVRGRFAREVALPVPDAPARTKILQLVAKNMRLSDDVNFTELGRITPGFVGSDLKGLVSEAGMHTVRRIVSTNTSIDFTKLPMSMNMDVTAASPVPTSTSDVCVTSGDIDIEDTFTAAEDALELGLGCTDEIDDIAHMAVEACECLEEKDDTAVTDVLPPNTAPGTALGLPPSLAAGDVVVTMADFSVSVKTIQPSAKREGFAVVPDVTFDDVGALSEVRDELDQCILEPIAHPERFAKLGLEVPAGVLFFGPPGCGKTLLAKALANKSGANFISVKGPELLNMYVGESESKVRQVFTRARASAPCVIFFDELDALCPKRGMGGEGGSGVSERVVNQLLTELDGLEARKDVYIVAATNRLELIDDAMLRPGRLGKLLYVPLPTASVRTDILKALTRKVSIGEDVNVEEIGSDPRCEGFSGADMSALVREGALAVIREWRTKDSAGGSVRSEPGTQLQQHHFDEALKIVRPSVAEKDRKRFELVNKHIINGMGAIQALQLAAKQTI